MLSKSKSMFLALAVATAPMAAPAEAGIISAKLFDAPDTVLTADGLGKEASLQTVTTEDGLVLKGIVTQGDATKPVVLVFHGKGSGAGVMYKRLKAVREAGYPLVIAEYRGFGGNAGKPTQDGVGLDANAWFKFSKRYAAKRPVVVFGHSLGGGIALDLSRRRTFDYLITFSTFSKVSAMLSDMQRLIPNSDPFDNLTAVERLNEPAIIAHGTADETVPFKEEAKLAKAAAEAGRKVNVVTMNGRKHSFDGKDVLAILSTLKVDGDKISQDPKVALPSGINMKAANDNGR